MIGRIKAGGGSGALNVYAQVQEPAKKDGIWIKFDEVKLNYTALSSPSKSAYYYALVGDTIYRIYGYSNNTKFSITNNSYTNIAGTPNSISAYGTISVVGTNIYLFYTDGSNFYAYKYDTLLNSFSSIANVPYNHRQGKSAAVGTDIYIFGGNGNKKATYKYDTTTNTYTQLTDIPYEVNGGVALASGTDIYVIYDNRIQKYDTLTDTYTQIATNFPYDYDFGAVIKNNRIYANKGNTAYMYDLTNNTSTQLNNAPVTFNYTITSLADSNYIYVCDSSNTYKVAIEEKSPTYKYDYEGVNILSNIENISQIDTYSQLTSIPNNFYGGSAVAVGNVAYLFGSAASSSYYKTAYSYNATTDTYTSLTNIPFNFYYGSSVVIDNIIYLFGGNGVPSYAYKYNIATNSYTQLTNIPFSCNEGSSSTAIGKDIYLFKNTTAYKYNIATNSYTQLTNIPRNIVLIKAIAYHDKIYLFDTYDYDGKTLRYDPLSDTYEELTSSVPIQFQGGTSLIGTDIYFFGRYQTGTNMTAYKYDILTDTFTQLTDVPYSCSKCSSVAIGMNAYIFGGTGSGSAAERYTYRYNINYFLNNNINILSSFPVCSTKLTDKCKFVVSNAYIYENNQIQINPVYYGDGTSWNLIS